MARYCCIARDGLSDAAERPGRYLDETFTTGLTQVLMALRCWPDWPMRDPALRTKVERRDRSPCRQVQTPPLRQLSSPESGTHRLTSLERSGQASQPPACFKRPATMNVVRTQCLPLSDSEASDDEEVSSGMLCTCGFSRTCTALAAGACIKHASLSEPLELRLDF